MGARLPILLPYGLSSEHKSFVGADKNTPRRHGPLCFRVASLPELLEPSHSHTPTLPPLAAPITASTAHHHLRIEKSKTSGIESKNNNPIVDMVLENSRENYRRPRKRRKPSTSGSKTSKNDSVSRRETRNTLNTETNLRLGASRDMPITLDSDSSQSVTSVSSDTKRRSDRGLASSPVRPAISGTDLGQSPYQHQNQSACSRQRSLNVTPLQNSYVSSGFSLCESPPAHALHSPKSSSSERETSLIGKSTTRRRGSACMARHATTGNEPKSLSRISRHRHAVDQRESTSEIRNDRPTNMRYGRYAGTFSRTKSKTPGPWQYRHLQTNSKGQREFSTAPPELDIPPSQGLSKTSEAMGHNQKDMTLLDIDDFELRSKVAQLMAVAPALPIIELYHLVIDSEGCMAQAKKRARATSKAPYAAHTFTPSTFAHSRNIVEGDKNDEDGYSEDVVVKVDPSNLAFEWDDDDPASRSAPTLKARPRSNLGNKATDSSLLPLLKKPKPTKTSETSSRSAAKRLKVSSSQRRSTRETSSDRDFIVADNVMEYVLDSDESHELDITCYTGSKKRALPRQNYSMI